MEQVTIAGLEEKQGRARQKKDGKIAYKRTGSFISNLHVCKSCIENAYNDK